MTRSRLGIIAVIGAASTGFAALIAAQAAPDPTRDAAVASTALAVGMLVFPAGFVGAVRGGSRRASLARALVPRRPLGHILAVAGYGAGVNGLYRLASFGEPGRPRALPMALYAVAAAWLLAVFVLVLARRATLLDPSASVSHRQSAGQGPAGAPADEASERGAEPRR